MNRERAFLALAAGAAVALGALQWTQDRAARAARATVLGRGAAGLSAAVEYLGAETGKKPFLAPEVFDGVGEVWIDAPAFPLSAHEAREIERFVARGGRLRLSAATPEQLAAVRALVAAFGVDDLGWEERPGFVNRAAARFADGTMNYAKLRLKAAACGDGGSCESLEMPYRRGEVSLVPGLSPFANGLLRFPGNRAALIAVGARPGRVIVDGYRQLLADRSWGDFFAHYRVSLPILFFAATVIAYLAFAPRPARARPRAEAAPPGYHALNETILAGAFGRKETRAGVLRGMGIDVANGLPGRTKSLKIVAAWARARRRERKA